MQSIKSISDGLELANDGIWYSSESDSISYPSVGNDTCFLIEDNSFWFKHRNECIVAAIKNFPPIDGGTIYDIGGGNGFVSMGLSKAGFDVVLVEPGPGAHNAKTRGIKNIICSTTKAAKFKSGSISAVGLFDVIEHIEDDFKFLCSIKELLQDGGLIYATVPAYSFLWSREDVLAGHFRRYNLKSISRLLETSGFTVEFSSYFFRFLPILTFLLRVLPYKLGLSKGGISKEYAIRDHLVDKGFLSKTLGFFLNSEIKNLLDKSRMGFGGSCLIVARKL